MRSLLRSDPEKIGPFKLVARLGSGGMGIVYLASRGSRSVALKVLNPGSLEIPEHRGRFVRETDALRSIDSPNVAKVIDAGADGELPWLAVEFINGPDLRSWVEDRGPLSVTDWQILAEGLLRGIVAIHDKGLIHRDIKPANILMSESGPKIIDFGIAQDLDATSVTVTGTVAGSPAWLSPEQIDGISLTPATDIFSVGSVLAFAATGESPWGNQSTTTSAVFNRILNKPPNLETLPEVQAKFIEDLLQKLPRDRPSAKQALATLKRELEGKIQETKVLPKPKPKPKAQTQVQKENTKTRTSPSPKLERPKRIAKASPVRTRSKKTKLTILLSLLVVPLGLVAAAAAGSVGNFVSSIVENSAAEKQESPIMPDFTGKSVAEVTDFLSSVGITKWSEVSIDSPVEKGLVGGTIPEPGIEIDVDFWNSFGNTFQILVSGGVTADSGMPSNPTSELQGLNTVISWTGMNLDSPGGGENGNWGFYTPTIANGVLQVLVDVTFEEDTTILLGTNCEYLVDGTVRLGCFSSLPSKIAASADEWIDLIPFELNIGVVGIEKPETFTVSLYIEDSKGIRNVKLNFVVGFWGNE